MRDIDSRVNTRDEGFASMDARWFFFRPQDDGTWCVVMVGHTKRHPPESETAEALDFTIQPNETEAREWARVRYPHGNPQLVWPVPN